MSSRAKFAVLWVIVALAVGSAGAATAGASATPSGVTSSSLGSYTPTFVGPAATGCASGCTLLSGPFVSPSFESVTSNAAAVAGPLSLSATSSFAPHIMPSPVLRQPAHASQALALLSPLALAVPPTVSCDPWGPGCDRVSSSTGGAVGVKGLNAVDSGAIFGGDIEPADQGVCGGNGYVMEANNQGEILIFNTSLQRKSSPISLDTVMGLTKRGWSSGGDISCVYDYDNGGHWFITEFVSASSEASGGTFAGCFAGVANTCYEGIAVSVGSSPFGPYNVYFLNSNYNPAEPGAPYLLNDFTKIAVSRDAFLVFYDEFPLVTPGVGGGGFNGAQEYAFNKTALERGLGVLDRHGHPNPSFTVAIENMGQLPTPDGTCASDNQFHLPGFTCWYSVIPAHPSDPAQYDNSHGGSAFMLNTLDYYGHGDNRIAVFDWTGLETLNSANCSRCERISFGGQLFSGVSAYYGEGFQGAQKSGPTPLGDMCGAAGLSVGTPPPASCPEGGIATNGDNFTQAAQAQGQLWGGISTEISQTYGRGPAELHQGAAYWVIGTDSFDRNGVFSLTNQGYVSPRHADLEFPAMAAVDKEEGGAVITFTLSALGGSSDDDGESGYYPSTAYGRLTSQSNGLMESQVNIADLGQSPQDGFTEYQGYPNGTRTRWGDYSWAFYMPSLGRIYFSTNYIQYPNCVGAAFSLALGTCGGTRNGFANWGTSVNYIVP
jgi:hypothetical protein